MVLLVRFQNGNLCRLPLKDFKVCDGYLHVWYDGRSIYSDGQKIPFVEMSYWKIKYGK